MFNDFRVLTQNLGEYQKFNEHCGAWQTHYCLSHNVWTKSTQRFWFECYSHT